jgi:hypothetical protein
MLAPSSIRLIAGARPAPPSPSSFEAVIDNITTSDPAVIAAWVDLLIATARSLPIPEAVIALLERPEVISDPVAFASVVVATLQQFPADERLAMDQAWVEQQRQLRLATVRPAFRAALSALGASVRVNLPTLRALAVALVSGVWL